MNRKSIRERFSARFAYLPDEKPIIPHTKKITEKKKVKTMVELTQCFFILENAVQTCRSNSDCVNHEAEFTCKYYDFCHAEGATPIYEFARNIGGFVEATREETRSEAQELDEEDEEIDEDGEDSESEELDSGSSVTTLGFRAPNSILFDE
jgi:hypothetical protein